MTTTPRIQVMPDQLANQIAAGEVVERPASVVKELVENSLDAEATRVDVEIEEGGRKLVRVTDDGLGMSREEALLSLQRHATSKILAIEDLQAIGTLGFRGEALPSIVSVSDFEIETRQHDAMAGTHIRAGGDAVPEAVDAGVPPGTRITVRELFHNVPARRKFLRTVQTEAGQVSVMMQRFAMGYPHVHFRLVHNGRTVLDVAPEHDVRNRVAAVLGRKVASRLFPVALTRDVEVEGLVSEPTLTRSNADGMYTYINGRFIRDRVVQHAITSAYGNLLDRGRYPYVVLYIRLRPELVDVNVHPTKAEVRFVRSGEVHSTLTAAIGETLSTAPWLEEDATRRGTETAAPVDSRPAPPLEEQSSLPMRAAEPTAAYRGAYRPEDRETVRSPLAGPRSERILEFRRRGEAAAQRAADGDPASVAPPAAEGELTGRPRFFSTMRYVGQVHRTYLLCESDDALHVIDQHAAHERVTYERLLAGFHGEGIASQSLLLPLQLEVTAAEAEAVAENEDGLARMGFELVAFGEKTISLNAVPELFVGVAYETMLRDLIAELSEHGKPRTLANRLDEVAARLACHCSVRAGDAMTPEEVRRLLAQLDDVEFRANCPHGRPLVVSYPFDDVARWFRRS